MGIFGGGIGDGQGLDCVEVQRPVAIEPSVLRGDLAGAVGEAPGRIGEDGLEAPSMVGSGAMSEVCGRGVVWRHRKILSAKDRSRWGRSYGVSSLVS